MTTTTPATQPQPTRNPIPERPAKVISIKRFAYEKMITLKHHVVDVTESADGVLTVAIIPLSDDTMDSTVVTHDANDNIVRMSTSRNLRTNAKSINKMIEV